MTRFLARLALGLGLASTTAFGADTVNVYSIWPENWARPMFEEFEKATGIKVNFIRFSSGEALARVMAEKNNPRIDVLFGGPVETFAVGLPGVRHAAYVGMPDPALGQRAVLCVECDDARLEPASEQRLRAGGGAPVDELSVLAHIPRDPRHASKTDLERLRRLLAER